MKTLLKQEQQLIDSLSNFKPEPCELAPPVHEREIVHLFDVHHKEYDINAIENSEAYYTQRFVLLPGSNNCLELCVLFSHNYFDCEFFSEPLIAFRINKSDYKLAREIINTIHVMH